jgi:hypothetical protein
VRDLFKKQRNDNADPMFWAFCLHARNAAATMHTPSSETALRIRLFQVGKCLDITAIS